MINGRGGNTMRNSGTLTLTGSAQQVPVPPAITLRASFDPNDLQLGGALIRLTPFQHDVWMGEDNTVTTSGATAGARLPAENTAIEITAVRANQVWVIGTNGDTLSFQWEWNG